MLDCYCFTSGVKRTGRPDRRKPNKKKVMEKKSSTTRKSAAKKQAEAPKAAVENNVVAAAATSEQTQQKVAFRNPFKGVKKEDRRARFRELTASLKEQAKIAGITDSTNQLILAYYRQQCGARFLRTIEEWNQQGKRIRKGSEPFLLWGPQVTTGEGDDQRTYFPMKFVYDIHQVYSPETAQQ